MNQTLEQYVGRIVRLNTEVYADLKARAIRNGQALENCFLVARVGEGLKTLICYGASFRIIVNVADVVLV